MNRLYGGCNYGVKKVYKVFVKNRFIFQDKTVPIRQANRGIKLMEDYLNGR